MGLFDFLSNAASAITAPGTVTIKTGRNSHQVPFETVKGKTLREVLREVAEYLQIDPEQVNFAERVVVVPLDGQVQANATYRPERVQLTEAVESDATYSVDITRGEKG
jgi:hypothetical protein